MQRDRPQSSGWSGLSYKLNQNSDYHARTSNTSNGYKPLPRTPIQPPTVYLDGHTLILYTEFEETIQVQLLDPDTVDDDEPSVVYSVNVPAGTQQVALPSTYTGEYGIRLVVGNWYFIGVINL